MNIEYWDCDICNQLFADEEGTVVITDVSDSIQVHDILNDNVKNYLNASTESDQISALATSKPYNDQVKKELTWAAKGSAPYRIEVSMNDDTFASFKSYSSDENSLELPGTLIPGQRYYYRVFDSNNTS